MGSIYSVTKASGNAEIERDELLARFPMAGTHNSGNYVFSIEHPNAINPIVVSELLDTEGEPLTPDAMVLTLAVEMIKPERDRAIHINKSEATLLHSHAVWRLWCGQLEPEQIEDIYNQAKLALPGLPEYSEGMNIEEALYLAFLEQGQ